MAYIAYLVEKIEKKMPDFFAQSINPLVLLGLSEPELISLPEYKCSLHAAAVEPFKGLVLAAEKAGFCLQVASSYRSFQRQLSIWNNKACGLRPVLDTNGHPLDMSLLSDKEKVFAILRWSALPGASRHHWGTDVDVYDSSRIPSEYSLQLTVAETQGTGPFAEFHQWLHTELSNNCDIFFRPYALDKGGIAPEPWHLSYAPVANIYAAQFNENILREQLQVTEIALKDALLENLSEIFQRFIKL